MVSVVRMKVKRLNAKASLPRYAHPDDAGLDLFAAEDVAIGPTQHMVVGTGISIELPPGTQGEIRPRSGLARDWGVTVLNSPGTIDEGYRGEIGIVLINHGSTTMYVKRGMRIGQLVIQRRLSVEVEEQEELKCSERGSGGFGSTGR